MDSKAQSSVMDTLPHKFEHTSDCTFACVRQLLLVAVVSKQQLGAPQAHIHMYIYIYIRNIFIYEYIHALTANNGCFVVMFLWLSHWVHVEISNLQWYIFFYNTLKRVGYVESKPETTGNSKFPDNIKNYANLLREICKWRWNFIENFLLAILRTRKQFCNFCPSVSACVYTRTSPSGWETSI